MTVHEKYMKRCIELAQKAFPEAIPNPAVGAVIVKNDIIVAEGYTAAYGGPHAEVNAIKNLSVDEPTDHLTLYVSLEPCSHYGKTPPCSDLIIKKGFKKVVVGCIDPFAEVAGRGIKKLKEAGCDVTLGVLEKECIDINRRFFTFHERKRPYIVLKWAESADGFISPAFKNEHTPYWISNQYSRQLTHKWRATEQAILVGVSTVVHDNPQLNTRDWQGNDPLRVILDPKLRSPKNSHVFDQNIKSLFLIDKGQKIPGQAFHEYSHIDFKKEVAAQICNVLYKNSVQSVIIEGGSTTLNTFIKEGLWDEARIFIGKTLLKDGVKAPEINGRSIKNVIIEEDQLKIIER